MTQRFLTRIDATPIILDNLSVELKTWLSNLSQTINATIAEIEGYVQPITTPEFTSLIVGSGGNFTTINDNGRITFDHDELYSNTASMFCITSSIPTLDFPNLDVFMGTVEQYKFGVGEYVQDAFDVMHGYKAGSDIQMFVHFATSALQPVEEAVKFEIEYTASSPDSQFTTGSFSQEIVIPAGTPDRTHFFKKLGDIPGLDIDFGAVVLYKIKRIASSNELSDEPFVLSVSAHFEIDSIGSNEIV